MTHLILIIRTQSNIDIFTGPTPPLGVALSSDNDLILQWSPPTFLYGTLTRYDILVASVDNPSEATVRDTTTETSYDLTRLDINAGVYFIFVSGRGIVCVSGRGTDCQCIYINSVTNSLSFMFVGNGHCSLFSLSPSLPPFPPPGKSGN